MSRDLLVIGGESGAGRRVIVQSIEGLYDERAEAVLMRVNQRKLCLRHSFINASLRFETKPVTPDGSFFSVSLESEANMPFNCEWGKGYGGIRFCRKCKLIDCIHLWDKSEATSYIIEHGAFEQSEFHVDKCRVCGRRILRSSVTVHKPADDAWRILHEEHEKLGLGLFTSRHYGSAFFCELPTHISNVFQRQGEEAARTAARCAFQSGDISWLS